MNGPVHLGKYRLLRLIATGGMGEVYLARHEGPAGFERTVVVKRVLRRFADDPRLSEMIVNEARIAALVIHPNAVQVYELGHEGGEYFIAMEYVHGRTLHQALDRSGDLRRVPPPRAAQIGWQLLQGLQAVHRSQDSRGRPLGIVHRDVSPDNVLVSFEGVVKVTDLGIMKSGVLSNVVDGAVQGKLAYLSPEQSAGLPVDPRTDVYSTGAVLYELLTGAPPFVAERRADLLRAVREDVPIPPGAHNPEVPGALERVILRALEKKPDARFPSAQAMAVELERYVASVGETLTPGPIAAWLESIFPGESALPPGVVPGASPRGTVPLAGETGGSHATTLLTGAGGTLQGSTRRRTRWALVAAALLIVSAGAAAAWRLGMADRDFAAPRAIEPGPLATAPVVPAAPPVGATARPETPVTVADAPPARSVPVRSSARAASRTGKLSVRVNPWANVYLNGRSLGVSPVGPLTVPAGRATVILRNPELGLERRLTVRITPNQELLLKEDLFAKR